MILIATWIAAGLLVLTGLLIPPGVLATNIATWITAAGLEGGPLDAEWNTCRKGTGEAAIAACSQIIQFGSPEDYNIAWAYNARGYHWQTKGVLDKAIADLDEAIRLDPDFALAYTHRGNAWLAKDEPDKALADFGAVVRLTPSWAVAHLNLGYAWYKKGELDKAIAEYDEAIRLDPSDTQAYINRGVAWLRMGEPDKAIADEDMVIRLDPKSWTGYIGRGNALRYKGEFDKAIADYDVAIRLDPKSPVAYHYRGSALRNKGEIDNAITDYDASLRINAGQDSVLMDRGLAWFAKSDYAHAQVDFAEAARLKPKFAYYAILVDIAGQRMSAPTQLPEAVAHLDMEAWPAPILRLFMGLTTEAAVLAAAENAPSRQVAGQVCEADFYAAEYAIGQGGNEEAIRLLRLASVVCPRNYIERFAVPIELKRLGQTP